jgi:phosphate transport system substrate-binding protein
MNILFFFAVLLIGLSSCKHPNNPLAYQTDTHGRGKAVIHIEESFKPLFETSIETFEGQYPKAHIIPKYKTETDIINDLYNRKAKTIVISRDLTEKEIAFLKARKIEVRRDKIAVDGIALIVHPSNKDTLLTTQQLKDIVVGKMTKWSTSKQNIELIYDNANSANFIYLSEFAKSKKVNKNVFAVKSNEEVIEFVKNNPRAIGVIGLNWISDDDDFDTQDFLKGIKVVSIAKDAKSTYFLPYAGFIYTKEYPLYRDVWMINKGKRSGLHTGFVIYMKSDIGQTIIQQAGIVPANSPIRLIQFTGE